MRLNPFKNLPNAKQVWAWGMYDLANQSFTLLIVTLFFSIYFQNRIAPDKATGKMMWGAAIAVSSGLVVLLGPLWGALADFSGRKKAWLSAMALGCGVLTVSLAFTSPGGPGMLWTAFILFVLANVMFMGGDNFLASFLPEIATRETMSRVSAIGWTMGYLGALLVLPIAGVIIALSGQNDAGFRIVFAFSGLWFLLNALPTLIFLKERKAPEKLPPGSSLLSAGFVRLAQTARDAPRFRELLVFLCVFFVYSCGMSTIIAFSGELAYQYLGAGTLFLAFCWVLSLIAGVGSVFTGVFQQRLGHRATLAASLVIWIVTSVGAAMLPAPGTGSTPWAIWLVGVGVGFGLGMTGNASRALVGVFTPAHKTAEFFSLWGMAYKMASMVGPPLYGVAFAAGGQTAGMLLVAAFFVLGLIGLVLVRVERGQRAAEEAERVFAHETDLRDVAAAARRREGE